MLPGDGAARARHVEQNSAVNRNRESALLKSAQTPSQALRPAWAQQKPSQYISAWLGRQGISQQAIQAFESTHSHVNSKRSPARLSFARHRSIFEIDGKHKNLYRF
jgi:hypothetical protein